MGSVLKRIDLTKYSEMYEEVEKHFEQLGEAQENLIESSSFNMVLLAKKYDDYFLDPVVGLILPGFGDFISSLAAVPALHVALFKLRSVKLTIAILYITILDALCGVIPIAGDVVDFFYKSNKKAYRCICGYVNEDPETISEINKSCTWGVVVLAILGLIIYAMFSLIMSIYHWFADILS